MARITHANDDARMVIYTTIEGPGGFMQIATTAVDIATRSARELAERLARYALILDTPRYDDYGD